MRLKIKTSRARFDDKTRDFFSTEKGKRFLVQEGSLELESKLLGKCAKQPSSSNQVSNLRETFLRRVEIKKSEEKCETKLRTTFRKDLIERMGSYEEGIKKRLWCPVVKEYYPSDYCIARISFFFRKWRSSNGVNLRADKVHLVEIRTL